MSDTVSDIDWVEPVLTRMEVLANFGGSMDREQLLALRVILKAAVERNAHLARVVEAQRLIATLERQFRVEIYKMVALVSAFALLTWLFS